MKKFAFSTTVIIALIGTASVSQAGSIDYLSNQSAEYIRNFARMPIAEGADLPSYNPAGTAFLRDGLHVNFNTQTVFKDYEITYDGKTYGANQPTPLLPSLFAVFKWNDLAAFASFTIPGGGGSLRYDDGVPFLIPLALVVNADRKGRPGGNPILPAPENGWFEGSSMYLAPTVGVAYKFFDMISVSAAGRFIFADKEYKGAADYGKGPVGLEANKFASGFGGIFGIHARPIKMLDIALRFETPTPLEFETESTIDGLATTNTPVESFADGAKEKKNLPAVFGAGLAVHPLDKLTVTAAMTYYFIKQADSTDDAYDTSDPPRRSYARSYNDDHGNGIELAFGAEYKITDVLRASLCYNRAWAGSTAQTLNDFEYTLSSNTIGGGARYTLFDRLNLTLGLAAVFYDETENETLNATLNLASETFNKRVFMFSFGAEYRFL